MEDSPPLSPKPRRRSSFFERRTSAIMPALDSEVQDNAAKLEEELKNKNIELYMDKLNEEKKLWEDFSRAHKATLKELRQKKNSDIDAAPLSPEDLEFLSTRPDFSKTLEDLSEVTHGVASLLMLQRRLQDSWLRENQAKLDQASPLLDCILDNSRIC